MLLRRITEHVKAQSWTAVVLDFLIVVVGVFIGIQVSNWNEVRNDRLAADAILDRLEQDFVQILDRTDRSLRTHEDNLAATGRLIRGIRNGELVADSLEADVTAAGNFATPPGPSTTFLELVSGNRLRLIENADLRRALHDYNSYVTFVRSQYGYFTEPLMDAREALMSARTLIVTGEPSVEIAATWASEDVDAQALTGRPEILVTLQLAYGTQDNIHAVLLGTRGRIDAILEMIRQEQARH